MEHLEKNSLLTESVRILESGYQEECPQELQKKLSYFLSSHPLDGDDPLEAWYQYINWAEENFPESGWRENIKKLLLTCLDKFNTSEEYFQDVRFIKLWIKYAEMAEDPLLIYNQLSTRGIGIHSTLFYKSWADELFRNGDFKKADKVFREGLKRKAQPLNKLHSAYQEFHVAVARRLLDETKMQKNSEAKHEKWNGCKLISYGRKVEPSKELSDGETYPVISSVLKPVENIPSRFDAKCGKGIEETVHGKSKDENGTHLGRVEGDTKLVPKVNRNVNYHPVHGAKSGNTHSGYKLKNEDDFHCAVAIFEVPNPSQRPMYPKAKVYADNTEYSLEELRAARYIRKEANTHKGNHSHHVMDISNQMRTCDSQKSPLTSVVDKKLAEMPCSANKIHHPRYGNEENVLPFHATGDGKGPTSTMKCKNVGTEHVHSSETYQHSLTSAATKSAVRNMPTEVLTTIPGLSFKETSSVPDSGKADNNLQHVKELALSACESKIISQFVTNNSKCPRSNPLLCEAEQDLTVAKEPVSSISSKNITLRSESVKKYQVHPFTHINNDVSETAVHTSIMPLKAEIISDHGYCAAEPEDLKEDVKKNNGSPSASHTFKYEIPFVPSPGMSPEEIGILKGTENKENESRVPNIPNNFEVEHSAEPKLQEDLTRRISSQELATGLGIVGAMHVDKDFYELQPRQSALFSDTCCSQMFAHTLMSSTPVRKSIIHFGNGNSKKRFRDSPVHATNKKEDKLRNLVGKIQHETDQLPFSLHTLNSKSKEVLNPVNDPSYMNKTYAASELPNGCTIVDQQQNFQSRELKLLSNSDGRDDINPFDDVLISRLLHDSGFIKRSEGGWLKILRKPLPRIRLPFTLKTDNNNYQVVKEIGKGSYARILCATDNSGERVALKVQKPSWLWEAYIEEQIQLRIKDKNMGLCFACPKNVYQYIDASIMVHEYLKYGSILNFITEARKINRAVNENVTFSFMCKIIEAIRRLHSCKIIHGDLKPDNIMIKSVYPPSIQLIDFGRAIDMTLFPPKTTFTYVVSTKDFQCTEMQEKKPWTYQTDIFGLVSTAHCFLFGEYMKVSHKNGKWGIQKSLPRSCHKQLWSQFFHDLLNIESCDKIPDLNDWEAAMKQEIDVTVLDDHLKVIKNVMDGF